MANSLDKLVDDVLIQILHVLSVDAVLSLRMVSPVVVQEKTGRLKDETRRLDDIISSLNSAASGPVRPLSLLSAVELEQRTLRALYLERAWPRLSARTLVSRNHQHGVRVGCVDQVVFIPGGTELLTVQDDKVVHWLIVSWPGFAQGLKHIAEWTPVEGVPCRIVKDGDVPGVFAVGPRDPLGSQQFAKVFSTSLKAPFSTLCDYARVPGIVAGVWRHLLLLDTTREVGGGGLELLDWHVQTTGTALLPCLPDLFGSFLDFVVFSDHLLVVWEYGVSVFPIADVPVDGQVVVEHRRMFMFQEAICRPVGFTTCLARSLVPYAHVDLDVDCDMSMDLDEQCISTVMGMSPTLTIAARSRRRADSVSMVMLIPLLDNEGRERAATDCTNSFLYRLAYLPPHSASTPSPCANQVEEDDCVPRMCTTLCLGWSGRGVFVVGRELRLVSPGLHILPPYEMQLGPVFETGKASYRVETRRDLNWLDQDEDMEDGADEWDVRGDRVDFDEGMGRFVVAREYGGFEVVQLS